MSKFLDMIYHIQLYIVHNRNQPELYYPMHVRVVCTCNTGIYVHVSLKVRC